MQLFLGILIGIRFYSAWDPSSTEAQCEVFKIVF
jgi:hypothetical protein